MKQAAIALIATGVIVLVLSLFSNFIIDFYNQWRSKPNPKPKYNHMEKQCEYCLKWAEPEKFIFVPLHGGQYVSEICRFCGREFKTYSKSYYQPGENYKHPKQKVKIEIEEITKDSKNI